MLRSVRLHALACEWPCGLEHQGLQNGEAHGLKDENLLYLVDMELKRFGFDYEMHLAGRDSNCLQVLSSDERRV